MIAAGVNAKALSTYVGHADIATTFNKYGHLMPGNEDQAAGLLDTYSVRQSGPRNDTAGTSTGTRGRYAALQSGPACMYYI
jgi:hypothetical protein